MKFLLASHLLCTIGMFGVIWIVQLVHYPLFEFADRSRYVEFQAAHESRISLVVLPLMIGELATAILLVVANWNRIGVEVWLIGLVLLVAVWASTFLLSVPEHARLSQGFDSEAHGRLIATNWIRTLGWSIRAVLVLYGAFQFIALTRPAVEAAT